MEFLTSLPVESPVTVLIPLLLLGAVIHSLRHAYYGIHIMFCAVGTCLAERYLAPTDAMFSHRAMVTAAVVHFISINFVTWRAYVYDKRASATDKWRIPERTLNAFALIGGSPAALISQKTLRHKTKKQSFLTSFWMVLVVQVVVVLVIISKVF